VRLINQVLTKEVVSILLLIVLDYDLFVIPCWFHLLQDWDSRFLRNGRKKESCILREESKGSEVEEKDRKLHNEEFYNL